MKRPIGSNKVKDDLFMPNKIDWQKVKEKWPEIEKPVRMKDRSGYMIGKWTVHYYCGKKKNNQMWIASCACGTIRPVNIASLVAGRSFSCGCRPQNHDGIKLEPGMVWNDITILADTGKRNATKRERILLCKDKEGYIFEDKSTNIKNKNTKSAGLSQPEKDIYKILATKNHKIKTHIIIPLENFDASYDFWIDDKYIIEYDGLQHFYNPEQDSLEYCHSHDLAKNKYCFENNIPLIRIPYNIIPIYDDLNLLTSQYILTKENEEEYYEKIELR